MVTVSIRAAILYLASILCVRLMGKRQLGQLQPYEWVMALLIADLAAAPMENVETPLLYGLMPMAMLLLLHGVLTVLDVKCPRVRKWLCAGPTCLIRKGILQSGEMLRCGYTLSDLQEEARSQGISDITQVHECILESSGKVSMLLKSPFLPVTRGDLNISGADAQMPRVLVMDGRIMGENLVSIGRDAKWLARVIRNSAHCGIDDVFFASVGEGRKLFIQDKRGSKPVQVVLNWDKRL